MAKKKKTLNMAGVVSALDKRGHEVRKYQDENGAWLVERNNNGSVHPEPCADEAAATALFTSYVEAD